MLISGHSQSEADETWANDWDCGRDSASGVCREVEGDGTESSEASAFGNSDSEADVAADAERAVGRRNALPPNKQDYFVILQQ